MYAVGNRAWKRFYLWKAREMLYRAESAEKAMASVKSVREDAPIRLEREHLPTTRNLSIRASSLDPRSFRESMIEFEVL